MNCTECVGVGRAWVFAGALLLGVGCSGPATREGVETLELPVTAPRIELSTGIFHTCARYGDGKLRCWGNSVGGQLGYGNTQNIGDDESPASAGDVQVGDPVVHATGGLAYTCAIVKLGAVRCWGYGPDGELGEPGLTFFGDDEVPATGRYVSLGGPAVQLDAGWLQTCAVLLDGTLRCWGHGTESPLGYGNLENVGDNETPRLAGAIDVGGKVLQVAVGTTHTCALLEGGRVRCWGFNGQGELGYGNTEQIGDDEAPAAAGDVDVGGKVLQIAVGGIHTCALLEGGSVRCWGSNFHSELGYPGLFEDVGDDETPASVGDVDVGGKATRIYAGLGTSCALLESGGLRCWGEGNVLGYGNTETIGDDETPASAGDLELGGPVRSVAVGGTHACAVLQSGSVRCWGLANYGQLGYGNTEQIGDDETPAQAGDVPLF